jgi:hypothetical protein
MAHFAQLNDIDTVIQVIVVHDNGCKDSDGNESEAVGIAFCKSLFGADTRWAQTSYNGNFRKNYAGIGYVYDPQRDAFISPKPFASWVLNEETAQWKSPVPMPIEGMWSWDEETTSWVAVQQPE